MLAIKPFSCSWMLFLDFFFIETVSLSDFLLLWFCDSFNFVDASDWLFLFGFVFKAAHVPVNWTNYVSVSKLSLNFVVTHKPLENKKCVYFFYERIHKNVFIPFINSKTSLMCYHRVILLGETNICTFDNIRFQNRLVTLGSAVSFVVFILRS